MTILKINIPKRTVDLDEGFEEEKEKPKSISWFTYIIKSMKLDCLINKELTK